jgi:hypothetical protein
MIKMYVLEPVVTSYGKSCPFAQGPTSESEPLKTSALLSIHKILRGNGDKNIFLRETLVKNYYWLFQ